MLDSKEKVWAFIFINLEEDLDNLLMLMGAWLCLSSQI